MSGGLFVLKMTVGGPGSASELCELTWDRVAQPPAFFAEAGVVAALFG